MRIQVSKKLPPLEELIIILKDKFSKHYSYKIFGLGKKSIIIGKSTLVGAEISTRENEISIAWSPPSVFGGALLAVSFTELVVFLLPFLFKDGFSQHANYIELEKEIGIFLKNHYN